MAIWMGSNVRWLWSVFVRALLTVSLWSILQTSAQGGSLQHKGKINFYRTVPEGSSVDLSCELNDPTVDVRLWQMLPSGAMFTPRKGVAKYGQLFTLQGVSNKMQGLYLCRVRSRRFSKNIGRIVVTPRLQDPPRPNVTARYQGVVVHRNKYLTCTAKGKTISSVQWYKNARPLSMLHQEVRRRYDIAKEEIWINTLLLKNVTKTQGGWYECRAFITAQKFGFWSTHTKLNVLECPEPNGKFADPQSITGYLVCSGGKSTRMNCSKGLVWRDVKNMCGTPAKALQWESKHSFQQKDLTVGDSVIISCRMNDPRIRVKLKQKLSSGMIKERMADGCRVSRVGQTFVIHAVDFHDAGIYLCEAPSAFISRKQEVYLMIKPAPSSTIFTGHRNLFASYGSSVDLNCGAEHIYQPMIFLEIIRTDGIIQLTPDSRRIFLTSRTVTIHGMERTMRGKVICRVISSCDQAQEDVDLGFLLPIPLRGKRPVPELSQQLSEVKEGDNLIITCSASGKESRDIAWFKNKTPVAEKNVLTSGFRSELKLYNVSSSDAGDYECRIMDFGVGYFTKTATVKVKGSTETMPTALTTATYPSASLEVPSPITIIPYQTVDINCSMFQADIELKLWHETTPGFLTERIPDGIFLIRRNNTFRIIQGRQSDEGKYYCQNAGFRKIQVAILTFPDKNPPKIINFTTRASVNASQNVRLFCETEGTPFFANIKWFRNGHLIGSCTGDPQRNKTCFLHRLQGKYSISRRGSGAELVIKKAFHPFDSGIFTCVAINSAGTDNKTVTLDIHEKPLLNKKNHTDFLVLSFGDATTIQSTALRGHPVPHFKWFQQPIRICNSGCKPDARKWRRVPRHAIDPSEKVPSRISSLFLPPAKSGYFFRCIAENSLGHDDAVFSVHRVDREAVLPEIVPSSTLLVDELSSFTISCKANLGDFEYLEWKKRDSTQMTSTISTRNRHNTSTTLSIRHAQLGDAGDYLCYGWTANETKISVITVFVAELVVPVVSLLNQTIQEEKVDSTTLKCIIASGYPPPNVTWYKDGAQLRPLSLGSVDDCRINGFHYIENDRPPFTKDLLICKPNHAENTGIYRCEAENIKGKDASEAFLNVLAHPKISNMVDDSLAKELGEKVNVSCEVTGNPPPSVKWVKRTPQGHHVPVVNRGKENHTLLIKSLQQQHYGVYMCMAKNKFGNDSVVLSVVQLGPVGTIRNLRHHSKIPFIAAIVVGVALFLLLSVIAAIFYRRRQIYGGFYICTTPPLPDMIPRLDSSIPLIEQVHKLPLDKRWEFPRERLRFCKVLGSGAFGEVYLAEAEGNIISDGTSAVNSHKRHRLSTLKDSRRESSISQSHGPVKVAVKTLKEGAEESEHKDLISELKILIHIGSHKNIVNLLAACTKGRYSDFCLIIEYCPYGNMLIFLRNRREIYDPTCLPPTEDPDKQFSLTELMSAAFQVARAMEFLVSRKCVHRDLAARNVLIGENYVVKVADFGLARDVYRDDKYIKVSPGLVPVKWMAIESLVDRVYSEQSDVWSFGIFLWELFTLGGNPYPSISPTEIYQYIKDGNRMERPLECPEEMYALMTDCWTEKPEDRPNFTALVQRLDHVIESNSAAMGREGYLELEDEPTSPNEEMDEDGYLKPTEISPLGYKSAPLNGNVNVDSNKDLSGVNSYWTSEPKSKDLHCERYIDLGFKPTISSNDLAETVL
ncbi:vascular endothelial growth factor receptor 2-like [Stylophora pistillata]|uniref:vascular endothelial growth factor receptor 2-like n=1 Tax=Stylophora pistillata TaxID=50429 RepID=UPI000C053137|nr:vascular endothelial growth factor receptor 2-like [Stylophora pistillata]